MRSGLQKLLKSLLMNSSNRPTGSRKGSQECSTDHVFQLHLQNQNPVNKYYQHRIATKSAVFTRFAIQTRSLAIREVFAKAATFGRHDLEDLLAILETKPAENPKNLALLESYFDTNVLLALAELLANTSRNDLDTHAALQIYDFVYAMHGANSFPNHHRLQYVEALGETARYEDVDKLSSEFSINELAPIQHELLNIQRIGSTSSSEDWLRALNQLYEKLAISEIDLSDDESLPLLDRLQLKTGKQVVGPKVSVIMPTFSPGQGIHTAIRSLMEQSWENLEIIIVDDASPAEYRDVFTKLAELDTRIRVVHQTENAGAYVARNAGLAIATGEYVITHDDDDWSHPDKVAIQALALENDEHIVATTSAHIRTTQNMTFQRVNMHAQYMQMNYSSLMFRRNVTEIIGPWDTVNRGGDSEFLTRLIENFGSDRVLHIQDKPLSFSRVWTGSLTSGEMGRGYFAYSRLLYRWSFRQWHWDAARKGRKAIKKGDAVRPYAVPTTFEPGDRNKDLGLFDVIYVTDFFRQAKFADVVLSEIRTLQERGLRVGYMHLFSPQTDQPAGFLPELFELQREGLVTQVSHDDIAEAKLLLVYDASVGMFLDQLKSSVVSRRSVVVDSELPALSGSDERSPTRLAISLNNLDGVFNTNFKAIGATPVDQQRLRKSIPTTRLLADSLVWMPHVDRDPGVIEVPRGRPKVGFHSYGNVYRWPTNGDLFTTLYISDQFETRLYGNLEVPVEKFGNQLFRQVESVRPEVMVESAFLESIDFWVYFSHYRLLDQVWKPVLRAMWAGKVVILPQRLEPIYGSAAIYSTASDVEKNVMFLAAHPQLYLEQAKKGQEFVEKYHVADRVVERVYSIIEQQDV